MENPNSPNEPNEAIPEVNPVIPEPNHVEDAHDPNEMVDIPDDEELDIEDEDVEIEVDDEAELIFPYEVEGDQTPPPRAESSDPEPPIAEPPNAESSNSVSSDSESSDSESEDEEADITPEPTIGTATQRPFAIRDFPRVIYEVGESSATRDSSYVGGLAPWALRHDLDATRARARLTEAELGDVERTLGNVVERLKILKSGENATLKKKLEDKEMRFYLDMVSIGVVPKPSSDEEDTERPRKKSKKSSSDGTEGPSSMCPPSDS
ncbi:hypothetical protein Tco_0874499 [Tanacetum coccineum]|uniref:Uncharacterized protein n=1 Tax=Tanacetum coccineum TaxID=301880 RepID=A0ABQ5BPS5_9ASTR